MSKISKSKRNYLYSPYQVNDSLGDSGGDTNSFVDPVLSGLPANLSRNLWDDWSEETMLQDDTTLANFASGMDMTFPEGGRKPRSNSYNFLDALIMEAKPEPENNEAHLIAPPLHLATTQPSSGLPDMPLAAAPGNYATFSNGHMEYVKAPTTWQPSDTNAPWPPSQDLSTATPSSIPLPGMQPLQQVLPPTGPQGMPQTMPQTIPQAMSQAVPQGMHQSMQQGIQQGMHQGMQQGMQQGMMHPGMAFGQNMMMPGFMYQQPMMGFNPMLPMSMNMMPAMGMNMMAPMPMAPTAPLMGLPPAAPAFLAAKPPLKAAAPFVQIARKPGTPEMSSMLANLLEEEAEKKNKKLERNRDSARESRRKQQKYVEVLEDGIQQLQITKEHIQRHRWGRGPLPADAICGAPPRHRNAFDLVKWTARQKRLLGLAPRARAAELQRCLAAIGGTLARLQASVLEMQLLATGLDADLGVVLGLSAAQTAALREAAAAMRREEGVRLMLLLKAYRGLRRFAMDLCALGPGMDMYFRELMSGEQMCKLLSWTESSRAEIDRLTFDVVPDVQEPPI
ncbi:hypothetical protein ACHHYP_15325 [Achlya hypogyna]|uniref:BZIP domain-containing protein n=1 Tax=Achlya hypogyna TaxID=1202772 RepID=A0A1V9YB61_ACHHY|nr:hypothetical protein ACHHYP_15325 [Achlya hypogyna]